MKAEELLMKGCQDLDIPVSGDQIKAFMVYLSELRKWTRTYNLTALKSDRDIIVKHFLDSLLYLKVLPSDAVALADAGSGAGFPGVPLKIVRPDMDISLIEASRKKTAFLRHIIRMLRLGGIDVVEQRIEKLGRAYERKFDAIISRATFSIPEFIDIACPYVKEGGRLILNKGPRVQEELNELQDSRFAGAEYEVRSLTLPIENVQRHLVSLVCN